MDTPYKEDVQFVIFRNPIPPMWGKARKPMLPTTSKDLGISDHCIKLTALRARRDQN